jgi:type I restriction enzyme M protein
LAIFHEGDDQTELRDSSETRGSLLNGDALWCNCQGLQHMIKSMAAKTGRMAVVLPHGALFRMGVEGKIRQKIIETDALDAVIGLGPNLFYGTGLAACILVFRARKKPARRNQVLIIDASRLFKKGRNQNTLEPEHVEQFFEWYRGYVDVPGAARAVSIDDIVKRHVT